jgi:hypothetical protein
MFFDISSNANIPVINEASFYSLSNNELESILIKYCNENSLTDYFIISQENPHARILIRFIFYNGSLYSLTQNTNRTVIWDTVIYYSIS